MNAKYSDVVTADDVLAYIDELPDGGYNLPSGVAEPR